MISALTITHLMTVLNTAGWAAHAHRESRGGPAHWIESFAHSGVRAAGWYLGRDLYAHLGFTTVAAVAVAAGIYFYARNRTGTGRARAARPPRR